MIKVANLVHGPFFDNILSIHMNILKFLILVFAVNRQQDFGHI